MDRNCADTMKRHIYAHAADFCVKDETTESIDKMINAVGGSSANLTGLSQNATRFWNHLTSCYNRCDAHDRARLKVEIYKVLDRLKVLIKRASPEQEPPPDPEPTDPPTKPKRKKAAQPSA